MQSEEGERDPPGSRKNTPRPLWKRVLRLLLVLVLIPVVLLGTVAILLYVPAVQDLVRGKATAFLSQRIGSRVELERLTLRFPIGLSLQGLHIEDQRKDTLLHAGEFSARVSLTGLLERRIAVTGLALSDARVHLEQDADSVFNFQFIVDAFTSDTAETEDPNEGAGWAFTVDGFTLRNIHFSTDMRPSQLVLDVRLGELDLPLKTFDLDSLRFHAGDLHVADTRIALRSAPSAPEPDTYPDLEPLFGDLDLAFERADLERVAFTMGTVDRPDSLWLNVGSVGIGMHGMDTRAQRFAVDQLSVEGLHYGMVSSISSAVVDTTSPAWSKYDDGFRYFLRDLDVAIDRVDVRASSFAMHEERISTPNTTFDPAHIVVDGLGATLEGVIANNGVLAAHVKDLHGDLGAAAQPFSLRTNARVTAAEVSLGDTRIGWQDLIADLSLSARQGSLQQAYRRPELVPLDLTLRTAVPIEHQQQLQALLPPGMLPIASVPEGFKLDAHVAGTLEELDTIVVDLRGDAGTKLHAQGSVEHAMDAQRMVFDVRVDPFTMGSGVRAVTQAYAKDAPYFPAQLSVSTTVKGDPSTISADLDLRSDLANAQGTLRAAGWKKDLPDVMAVDLRASGVALGRFLGDTAWSDADVDIRAEAEGLNTLQRQGWLEVQPRRLQHGSTDLSDTRLRVDVQGDSVLAYLDAKSEPLTLALEARGTWPEKGDSIKAGVDLSIARADLHALGFTPNELAVIGEWQGCIALDTAMHGGFIMDMDSTRLESGSERFMFEKLYAQAYLGSDSTSANIRSDAIDLTFDANIGMDTLLVRAVEKGRSFLTTDTIYHVVEGERLDLVLDLKRTEWLTDMLVPGLHAIDLEKLEAHYDGTKDELSADLVLPYLLYDSLEVRSTALVVDAKGATLKAGLSSERLAQGSYAVEGLAIDASGSGGDLAVALRITEEEVDRYRIGVEAVQNGNEMLLKFSPRLVLDGRDWDVDERNRLLLAKDRAVASHLILSDSLERIAINTPGEVVRIELEGFRIATLANIISTPDTFPMADGTMNGTVDVPIGDAARMLADLTIDDLYLLNTQLGSLDVDLTGEAADRFQGRATLSRSTNRLDAKVDKTPERLHAMAAIDLEDVSFLKPFVNEYLYELSGGLDGTMEHREQSGRTNTTGRMHFKQARVGVVMTGATYTLADETLTLTDAGLHFDGFELLDSLGNAFRLDGDVITSSSTEPRLDLRVRTDRFQLVNSTIEQNPQFFGDLFARIDLRAQGLAKRPKVNGDVGVLTGTRFSVVLPGTTVELISNEGIVVFTDDLYAVDTLALNGDAAALRDSLEALLPGVELDLHITADKEAEFAIVLDPAAGDQATVSGEADLTFRYVPGAAMYLSGPFVVERGEYTLDLYGLVKKRFELVKGGSVRWSGDPVKAEMGLQARFRSETAPYALVATGNTMLDAERNRLQQPLPFDVMININGSMSAPDIGFGIDLDKQIRNTFPKVNDKLNQLAQQGNAEELNRQVFGLLVLNSFIQDEGSGGDPSSGIATSAARNSVNGLLTDQMNKLTGRYLKGVDISLGVNTYDQVSGQSSYQRTSLDYRVSKRVLNDRLSFEVGGSVGVDEQSSQVSNVSNTRAAQYAILYDLTPDGRFRIRGFHENSYDLYDGEITNSGVAFMFTKDFEENDRARASGRKVAHERKEAEEKLEREQQDAGNDRSKKE
ncbi:MAG: translocation/assembly module TamB domain-containing protein [Flavobacteriales bacterium]|nr:translocation/assembly module TamB domain-containing protein [Flavobacteriales bacterium]